jgi:drug/metabolite transporter (DMT)-like permease
VLYRRDAIDTCAVAMMIGLTLSWGLNGVAAKLSNSGYSPVFLTLVRSALGGALVFAWCRWRGIRLFERDGTLWLGIVAGLLFTLEFLLIFVGLVLVFSDELSQPGPDAIIGDVMSLCAGLAWAATYVLIKGTRLVHAGPEKLLLYQLAIAAIVAVLILPFAGPAIRDANAVATWALFFQSIYIVAVTYVMWFWLVRHYPASGLASFTFLTPAFGVLFAGLILGEPLGVTIFVALVLIAGGLALVNRAPRQQAGQ